MSWLDPFLNGAIRILDGIVPLPARDKLAFGSGLAAADNPTTGATDITVDGTLPAAPGANALVLQSTGAASTAWRPVAPTLVPSGGSDVAQIAAGLTAAGHVALTGTMLVNVNTTIGSAGQLLHFYPDAKLRPAAGVILTVGCWHTAADDQHIFDLSAGGIVHFAASGPQIATPEHFGAARDGATDDSAAIQAAHDAFIPAAAGGTVKLLRGRYALGTGLVLKTGIAVQTAFAGGNSLGTTLFPLVSMSVVSWSASSAPQKETYVGPLVVAFSGVANAITNGHNSSIAFDLKNLKWGVIDSPRVTFSGTTSQGGTGFYLEGDASGSAPYYNHVTNAIFTGIQDANCLGAHFASPVPPDTANSANGNRIDFQSCTLMKHAVWFGAATENLVIITEAEALDTGSSYFLFGDDDAASRPSGSRGNRVILSYYESSGLAYLARFGAVTTANEWNVIEAIDNGITMIDPGGDGIGTNQILLNGHQSFADWVLRGTYKSTLAQSATADRTLTLPDVSATLRARNAGTKQVSTTGGTTTLTGVTPQTVIEVTGTLTTDATIEVPALAGVDFIVDNGTAGAHKVTVKPVGGTGVEITQGMSCMLHTSANGTSCIKTTPDILDSGAGSTTIGADTVAFKTHANITGFNFAVAGGFLTINATGGMNVIGSGGSGIGFAVDSVTIGNSALQTGGTLSAPGSGQLKIDATTSIVLDYSGTPRIKVDSTGLGFYNHAPAAQQAVTGTLSAVIDANAKAVLTSIIAALVATGLVTDGTT
jgi:hypothetical protein